MGVQALIMLLAIPGLNVFLSDEDGEGDGIFTYIFPHK